jgi:hypothetical protein
MRYANLYRPQVQFLLSDTSVLYKVIAGTSVLAEKISEKVRRLDLEQVTHLILIYND